MTEPLLVLCTAPNPDVAAELARGLVEGGLAACVNIVGAVRSIYAWEGAIHDDAEVQLLIKSRRARYAALEAWLIDNHPYDVPEVLAVPIAGGSSAYLAWLNAQTSS